jgi:hypothetical protein
MRWVPIARRSGSTLHADYHLATTDAAGARTAAGPACQRARRTADQILVDVLRPMTAGAARVSVAPPIATLARAARRGHRTAGFVGRRRAAFALAAQDAARALLRVGADTARTDVGRAGVAVIRARPGLGLVVAGERTAAGRARAGGASAAKIPQSSSPRAAAAGTSGCTPPPACPRATQHWLQAPSPPGRSRFHGRAFRRDGRDATPLRPLPF